MTSAIESRAAGAGTPVEGFGLVQARSLVDRLRQTYATGRTRPLEWRTRQLDGVRRFLAEQEGAVAEALAADLGRRPHDAWFGDVAPTRVEADYAIRHLARWARPRRVPVPLALMPGRAAYRYEPLGVVLVIGPWNYPFYLCLAPLIGALAAGNCVIVKPSERAPASSATMAELLPRYLDPDAVSVVEGEAAATQALIDARVDHVFFTGGRAVGRKVMEAASRHLTPVTLELGGKCPAIVTRDADIDVAARRITMGKLLNSGQTCLAPDYVLVDEPVKDRLVAALTRSVARMTEDRPGPLQVVDTRQAESLAAMLDGAGRVVSGGGCTATAVEPTIVVDPAADSPVMAGEIFGPILPVLGVESLDQAVAFVNSREKPLAAYVFSEKPEDHERVFRDVPSGGAVANHTLMHVMAPQLPFGGVGESGMGAYHGRWGFETFSHRKATLVMRSRPDLRLIYPPYSAMAEKLIRKLV